MSTIALVSHKELLLLMFSVAQRNMQPNVKSFTGLNEFKPMKTMKQKTKTFFGVEKISVFLAILLLFRRIWARFPVAVLVFSSHCLVVGNISTSKQQGRVH